MAGSGSGSVHLLDNKFLVSLIFILLGIALYQSGFSAPWYLDDGNNIVNNPLVKDFERAFAGIFKPRGFANFTFAANYHFAGMTPYAFRLTNVAIHIGAALLVWRLLARLYPTAYISLCGGLLFLVHPLQTQAVTYVVQRMAGMAAFFFLLSVYLYIRARESGELRRTFWYAGALLSAFLAIWTKQNTIFLPCVILFVDFLMVDQQDFSLRKSVRRALPFMLISAVAFLQQFYASTETLVALNEQAKAYAETASLMAATDPPAMSEPVVRGSFLDAMPLRYFATELIVFWLYLKLFFLPFGQMLDYFGSVSIVSNVFNLKTIVATVGWIVLFVTIHYYRLWNRRVVFGFVWIVLTLALESSFIPLDPVFEHRMYLPFFGGIIVVYELLFSRISLRVGGGSAVVILLVLSVMTAQRNALWADPVAFWHDNAEKNPDGTRVMVILAKTYLDRGDYTHAEEWYTKALNIESVNPDPLAKIRSSKPLSDLGSIRLQQGRTDEAQDFFERSLQNNPGNTYASANLGKLFLGAADKEKGIALLEHAFKIDPLNRIALNSLLETYSQPGNELAAENFYVRALSANPFNDQIRVALGLLLDKTGRSAEGLEVLSLALKQYPEEAKYFYHYGIVALHAGDREAYNMALDRLRNLSQVFFEKLSNASEKE